MTTEYSVVELLAKMLEYEHALEHIAQENYHNPSACEGCQRLAKSALDGAGRDDFRDIAVDILGNVCPVCHNTGLTYDETEQCDVPCGGLGCTVQT